MLPDLRLLRSGLIALVASGCNCSQDYAFPEAKFVSVEASKDIGSWLSMDVAPDGQRLVVAYYDREFGALGFAVGTPRSDGTVSWEHERVDGYTGDDGIDRGDRGKYASLQVATDGTVWVAYADAGGGLYAAQRLGPHNWVAEEVDSGASPYNEGGLWASLALTSENEPVIAHYEGGKQNLRVTRRVDGQWQSAEVHEGLDWSETDTDGTELHRDASVGKYARLVIAADKEYIAFYDEAQQTLDLLEGFGGSYTHTVVDASGNVGAWPSILVDGDNLVIAYQDVGAGDLKLAVREGTGAFETETIDEGEFRGADTEVFKKEDGTYAILYFDGYENDMMLATEAGGTWSTETIGASDAAVGFHNEVAFAGGKAWLASYDYTNRNVYLHALDAAATRRSGGAPPLPGPLPR